MATYRNTVNSNDLIAALATALGTIADGDTIEITKFANDYSSNCNLSTKDLLVVRLGVGFEGSFQEASNPLKLQCDRTNTGAFWNQSNSRLVNVTSSANTVEIYNIHQAGGGKTTFNTLKCNVMNCSGGTTIIYEDVDLTTLHVDNPLTRVEIRKASGAFAPTTINLNNGYLKVQSDIGALNIYEGLCELEELVVVPSTITIKGGTLRPIESGTIATLVPDNCLLDWSKLQQPCVVTNAVTVGPGVTIRYKTGGIEPTWTLSNRSVPPRIEYV